ncbi:AsmA-like C-terminal region-containing protein [Neotamlana laminarinivorans]|uniref:AsmA family protein n=1 Tax=Neotamlana laminarinivorans TaxID=2883124 RepID=A0A9X1I3D7_9FLAO|nr:AsmA-like C-terminal region-containing protein [Tamlana laminarinivorans]MCB4799923.1 AsmA family protein [Tamlana laminarinivorans]
MKKLLKIIGITLLTLFILLLIIPFAFQGKLNDIIKRYANESVNANVEFKDVSLSFIKSFPKAHISVDDLIITTFKPFENETLVSAKHIAFTMDVKELLKKASEDPLSVKSIVIDEALLTIKTDKFGNANYDIAKETENQVEADSNSSFTFDIQDYSINNSAITYIDEATSTKLFLTELNHEGHGTFSAESSELNTKTQTNVSFSLDSTEYLNNNIIKLDAIIGLDLANSKYTFKDNKGYINQLPIEFDGYVQLLEDGQDVDITFENPESDFKNFLALIPKAYSKSIENVKTTGNFKVKAIIKGKVTEETIPTLDISLTSNNASFKYPDLPKSITNIYLNTEIKNTTGYVDDTYVNINQLDFKIDQDVFKSSASLKNITKNMLVNANINGVLNLANFTKAYPIELETALTGILKANLNTAFDMEAIETNAYSRIKNSGTASITDFVFSSEDLNNPLHITNASMSLKADDVTLNNFEAKTGGSDINATGTIKNLMGFLLSDNTLKGDFYLKSNTFKVSDFMTSETETETQENNKATTTEALKIPAFLECIIHANANTVVYDNLNLKDLSGTVYIKDQQATLENLKSNIFNGALTVSGDVSTKNETPTFSLKLGADGFDISESFKELEMLRSIAPIANFFQGKLNTTLNFSGELDDELSPNLSSISGNALAELLTTNIEDKNSALISKLDGALNFIDFSKLNLKDLKTSLSFADGKVSVKPFNIKYEDIDITVSGSHGFDQSLEYSAILDVPAKYLGSEVNQLIGKINTEEANNITIPVTTNIGGSLTSPSVKTDLTSGVKNLTTQLIEIEKQKLLDQGKTKVKDMLGGLIGNNTTKTDSIKQEQSNTVNNVLKTIVSSKTNTTTKADSTATNTTKETVKNVLGGLFSKTKKAQDTVN